MPQETKAHPFDAENAEHAPGFAHENLEGWVPTLACDEETRAALEKAFDYRGDITITLKDGSRVEGYLFDRRSDGKTLSDCVVRLFPKDSDDKIAIRYTDIARLAFTGRDTAAGKSFETWVKKYHEKKAAGEKNIRSSRKSWIERRSAIPRYNDRMTVQTFREMLGRRRSKGAPHLVERSAARDPTPRKWPCSRGPAF